MTKRGWGPPWLETAPPTLDELEDLHRELTQWRLAHPEAMPPELWQKLDQLIYWQTLQCPMSRKDICLKRWVHVELGFRLTGSLKRAYKYAEDALRGTPAQAGIEMIKKDYELVERGGLKPKPHRRRARQRKS